MVQVTDTHVLAIATARVFKGCEITLALVSICNCLQQEFQQFIQLQVMIWCKGLLFMHTFSAHAVIVSSFSEENCL